MNVEEAEVADDVTNYEEGMTLAKLERQKHYDQA